MNVSFEDCGEFMGNLELRLAPVYIFLICMNIIIIYIYVNITYYKNIYVLIALEFSMIWIMFHSCLMWLSGTNNRFANLLQLGEAPPMKAPDDWIAGGKFLQHISGAQSIFIDSM